MNIPLIYNITEQEEFLVLKARSITFVKCKVENPTIKEGLVIGEKVLDSLYLSRCITSVDITGLALVSILNTDETDRKLIKCDVILEPPPKLINCKKLFIVRKVETNPENDRKNLLCSNIRCNHLNDEEKATLHKICLKIQRHIFRTW